MGEDVIDRLAGIATGSRLDAIRAQRPQARDNAQRSFLALFAPDHPGAVSAAERAAVATFVAALHREPDALAFYRSTLAVPELANAAAAEGARAAASGPYGHYPPGRLAAESRDGPAYQAPRAVLGTRLAAAFEHAHMLVFRPREASPAALQHLLDAGWSTTDIVTLAQLVAFLTFQLRVIAGLRTLASGGDAA